MTPTEIKALADRHLDQWFARACEAPTENTTLRYFVEAAITEALTQQAKEYAAGAETLRYERNVAREELARVTDGFMRP